MERQNNLNEEIVWPPSPHYLDASAPTLEVNSNGIKIGKQLVWSWVVMLLFLYYSCIFIHTFYRMVVSMMHRHALFPLPDQFFWDAVSALIWPILMVQRLQWMIWLRRRRDTEPALRIDRDGISTGFRNTAMVFWSEMQSVTIGGRLDKLLVILTLNRGLSASGRLVPLKKRQVRISRNYLDCTPGEWEFVIVPEIVKRVNTAVALTTPAHLPA